MDMLMGILNTCSKEELEDDTPISPPLPSPQPVETDVEARRRAIKNKILAIGRLSRVFQVLREESESVTELKTAHGGRLPAGALMSGAEGIKNAISGFEDARKVDLQNERLPPTRKEVDKIEEESRKDAVEKAVLEVDQDEKLKYMARRLSM